MDFSRLRGAGIEEDLQHRDFTANALAIDVYNPSKLIDPTGGVNDIRAKVLRACSEQSMQDDPVRVIRAVRFATDLGFTLHADTTAQVRDTVGLIRQVSAERIRDEFFQILAGEQVAIAVRLMDHLQILRAVFGKLAEDMAEQPGTSMGLDSVAISEVAAFCDLTIILQPEHDAEAAGNAVWGSVSLRLGRFRKQLSDYLASSISATRSKKSLVTFAILALRFKDAADSLSGGESHHEERAQAPSSMTMSVADYAKEIRLSRAECAYVERLVAGLQALQRADSSELLTDLDYHRYFRTFGEGGVAAVLLYLSSAVAQAAGPPNSDEWEHRLKISRSLLEAYFERYGEVIEPDPFLNGAALMEALDLQPGPAVGKLLDALREASVAKRVNSRAQAIEYARRLVKDVGTG
jgi:poly(A) polymerase